MQKYARSELEHLIEEWVIGRNSLRNKQIIRDGVIEGLSLNELASKYQLSVTRVKTVIRTFKQTVEAHE